MPDTPHNSRSLFSGNPNAIPAATSPIVFDEAGNPFFQDANSGRYVPYMGSFPQPMVVGTSRQAQPQHYTPLGDSAGPSVSIAQQDIAFAAPSPPPLPDFPDEDISHGPTPSKAHSYQPVGKTAGSRRVEKGKQRAVPARGTAQKRKQVSDTEDNPEREFKRGRPHGAGNYSQADIAALLDFTGIELPLGQRGWNAVHRRYTKWACSKARPERAVKSLETKFKQLVKTKKPTGDARCPPEIKLAHEIEARINERAGTCDIGDSEFEADNPIEISSEGNTDAEEPHTHTALIRRANDIQPRRKPKGGPGAELISKLSHALDPNTQRARDEERSNRSLQNTHYLAVSQQLRDANTTIEALRSQVINLQSQVHDAERARDRAEFKVDMLKMAQSSSGSSSRRRHDRALAKHTHGARKHAKWQPKSHGSRSSPIVMDGDSSSVSHSTPPPEIIPPYAQQPSEHYSNMPPHRPSDEKAIFFGSQSEIPPLDDDTDEFPEYP